MKLSRPKPKPSGTLRAIKEDLRRRLCNSYGGEYNLRIREVSGGLSIAFVDSHIATVATLTIHEGSRNGTLVLNVGYPPTNTLERETLELADPESLTRLEEIIQNIASRKQKDQEPPMGGPFL